MARIREHLIQETTRHGKTRYLFHQRPDGRRITISGQPGEPEFESRYQWLANGGDRQHDLEKTSIERQRAGLAPHNVLELGRHYQRFVDKEIERKSMAPATATHYARFTDRFIREFGPAPLSSIQAHQLERILDSWSSSDNAWNNALRSIKHLFRYAEKHWGLKPNPASEIEKRKVVPRGFEPWEPEDIQMYFQTHKLGSMAHLAMMLLIEVAPRRSDLVRLGPANLEKIEDQPCIKFTPQKSENKTAIPVTVPISATLMAAIAATPTGDDTFLVTGYGHPFTAKGFGNKMAQWRDEAGVRASVACHGMRKAVGINMAENDASPYEIMAALGHSSPKVTQVYTEAANRRKLAGKAASKSTLGKLAKDS